MDLLVKDVTYVFKAELSEHLKKDLKQINDAYSECLNYDIYKSIDNPSEAYIIPEKSLSVKFIKVLIAKDSAYFVGIEPTRQHLEFLETDYAKLIADVDKNVFNPDVYPVLMEVLGTLLFDARVDKPLKMIFRFGSKEFYLKKGNLFINKDNDDYSEYTLVREDNEKIGVFTQAAGFATLLLTQASFPGNFYYAFPAQEAFIKDERLLLFARQVNQELGRRVL